MGYKNKRIDGLFGLSMKNIISGLNGSKSINDVSYDKSSREDFLLTVGTVLTITYLILKSFTLQPTTTYLLQLKVSSNEFIWVWKKIISTFIFKRWYT